MPALLLAVGPDGNWALSPEADVPADFPSLALPPSSAPSSRYDALIAKVQTAGLLRRAGVPVPERGLTWQRAGFTVVGGREFPAYRTTWES